MKTVAFIGLGVMGAPMAGHLARAGNRLRVYNRTQEKAIAWVSEYGGDRFETPAQAAEGADFILLCVGDDDDLRSVVLGEDGALSGMREGAIVVDHTTASAEVARELAKAVAAKGGHFMDAPISGGQQGAERGQLTIMCGGTPEVYEQVRALTEPYTKAINRMGEVGAGQLTKMVNQIAVTGLIQALAEAIAFARKAGLDVQKVIDAISQGAASSWQMVNRHETMIAGEFNHGFAIDWMVKDLKICERTAEAIGADLPITLEVKERYEALQRDGRGRLDTSALLLLLEASQ
ncbi:MAG: NAD(P)-dependent oxidoreductase [Sandaracinaceae bacterium]|nr:NAD(P)-dependent oxidoreductase [Sandaracinaceae bacterium]